MGIGSHEDVMAPPHGDVGLLRSDVAQRLLASTELARPAYVAADGTPRVFPMVFHWTGPDVAITIDAPPEALLIRGRASVTDVGGIVPEYAPALCRYGGDEQGAAQVAAVDHPGTRMARPYRHRHHEGGTS